MRHFPDAAYEGVAMAAVQELLSARKKFPIFHSSHEGYAVMLEEMDEVWNAIKANDTGKAREEALQVAAMAIAFVVEARIPTVTSTMEGEDPA